MPRPLFPAWFFDFATGREYAGAGARAEAAGLLDDLADDAARAPVWRIAGGCNAGVAVRMARLEHRRGTSARLGFAGDSVAGEIALRADASGWLEAVVQTGGREVFRAWIDRPWEEIELHPAGATARAAGDPPGRMGKRRNWLSLRVADWPELHALSPEDWLGLERD